MQKRLFAVAAAAAAVLIGVSACGGSDDDSDTRVGAASSAVPFDRAFIDAMVPHHREAIEMAKAANGRGLTQADLQKISSDIIASQQQEIDQMLEWRESWYGSRELGPIDAQTLAVPESELGMGHGSPDEIAGAADVDATFAQMMIPHHEGAVAMAKAAEDRAQHEEVRDLAAAIIEAQQREIEIMEKHASGAHHGS